MEWSRFQELLAHENVRWCSIVGAPRCGTTSLARYLGGHPGVYLSKVKEPHFFSRRELAGLPSDELGCLLRKDYVDHFFPDRPDGSMLLDGSVSYLYAPERLEPLLRMWPESKFIIAVRNPLQMLPSLHQRNLCNGDENVRDFERAWALIGERRRGRAIPRGCIDPRLLDYEEIGRLGRHVRRFAASIGRERCFISVFDDLIADPAGQYARILEFLGLPPDGRTDFSAHRAGAGVRIAALQRILKRPPKAAWSLLASDADLHRDAMAIPAVRRLMGLRKRLLDWNRTSAPPGRLSPELRSAIRTALMADVADLSDFLGRDLSHWFAPSGATASESVAPARESRAVGPLPTARVA